GDLRCGRLILRKTVVGITRSGRKQGASFCSRKLTQLAEPLCTEMQGTELTPHELVHRMPNLGKHATHDAVLTGVQRNLHKRMRLRGAARQQFRRIGMNRAVLKLDTVFESLNDRWGHAAAHLCDVRLL